VNQGERERGGIKREERKAVKMEVRGGGARPGMMPSGNHCRIARLKEGKKQVTERWVGREPPTENAGGEEH